jgi:hypothetical protein
MNILAEINVSLVQRVMPAEEKLLVNRICTQESHMPKFDPGINMTEAEVTAPIVV